ncbi:hypothetical protein HY469_02035 [Candidatus Roizmanbacteria bacterium]|nr:hypothetical protein [Candidatus Roizmanbacteria bacterium]
MTEQLHRLGVLISGSGSTAEALCIATQTGRLPLEIGCVIASIPTAGGIERLANLGFPREDIVVVNPEDFMGDDEEVDQFGFGQTINQTFKNRGITAVSQNGWLPLTPEVVIDEWEGVIFNQHPGPKYETRGTHGIQPHAIMIYLYRETGRNHGTNVIIHRVNENWDDGATVARVWVPIYKSDSPRLLQKRAIKAEHGLQIKHWNTFIRREVQEIKDQRYIQDGEKELLRRIRKQARKIYPFG